MRARVCMCTQVLVQKRVQVQVHALLCCCGRQGKAIRGMASVLVDVEARMEKGTDLRCANELLWAAHAGHKGESGQQLW